MALEVKDSEVVALAVERLVRAKRISYLEAVVLYCEQNELEVESIAPYLSEKIKSKIGTEASRLHLVKHADAALYEN